MLRTTPSILNQLGQGKPSTKILNINTRSNSIEPLNNRTKNVALLNKKAMSSRRSSVPPRLAPLQNAGSAIISMNAHLKGHTANFCDPHIPRTNKALNENMMKTKLSLREIPGHDSPRKSIDLEHLKVQQRKQEKNEISERKSKLDTLIARGKN
jgi:hypothetical protein